MERSTFCENVGNSINHPIGIHQESFISHLGINKTPKYHKILLTKTRETKTTPNLFALWSPNRAPILSENIYKLENIYGAFPVEPILEACSYLQQHLRCRQQLLRSLRYWAQRADFNQRPPSYMGLQWREMGKTHLGGFWHFLLFLWKICLSDRFKSSGELF